MNLHETLLLIGNHHPGAFAALGTFLLGLLAAVIMFRKYSLPLLLKDGSPKLWKTLLVVVAAAAFGYRFGLLEDAQIYASDAEVVLQTSYTVSVVPSENGQPTGLYRISEQSLFPAHKEIILGKVTEVAAMGIEPRSFLISAEDAKRLQAVMAAILPPSRSKVASR